MTWTDILWLLTFIVSIAALAFSIVTYIRQERFTRLEFNNRLTDRICDINKMMLDNPDILRFLDENRDRKMPFFVESTSHDDFYFRVRAYIYVYLNFFDEILTIVPSAIESNAWVEWIVRRMNHPLFRELFEEEPEIWGKKFRELYDQHKKEIENVQPIRRFD